jgi:hypothetical protein
VSAPDVKDALTNELTANKLSVAFDKVYGLPVAKYKVVQYEESRDEGGVHAQVHLEHEKTRVTVRIKGPHVKGEFNWGLKIGKEHITEIQREDGSKHYYIDGYLRPA